jgi:hypothetical protein
MLSVEMLYYISLSGRLIAADAVGETFLLLGGSSTAITSTV